MNSLLSKKQFHFSDIYFFLMIICTLILFLSLPYRNNMLISFATKTMILSNIVGGIWALYKQVAVIRRFNVLWCLLLLIFGCISLVFGFFLYRSGITTLYENIVSLVCFFAIPLYVMYFQHIGTSMRLKYLIYNANVILSLIFIYLSQTPLRNIFYTAWGPREAEVTLGYGNPNQTAMYLLVCSIILISSLYFYRNKFFKIFLFGDIAYLVFLIYATESRTGVILIVLLFALLLYTRYFQLYTWQIWCVLCVSILYILLSVGILPFMQGELIMGQDISTGREIIYSQYFDSLTWVKFVFGDFTKYHFQNMHNGYITIIATAGFMSFIPFFLFCKDTLTALNSQLHTTHSETIAFLGLLCLMIHSSTEAAFLTGGVIYASLFSLLFALSLHPYSDPDRGLSANQ